MRNQGNSTWHLGPRTPSRAARVFLATEVEPSSAPSAHSCPSPGQREKLPTLITFSVPPPPPALSFPPPATLDSNNFLSIFPSIHPTTSTMGSLSLPQHAQKVPASGPLHCLEALPPVSSTAYSLASLNLTFSEASDRFLTQQISTSRWVLPRPLPCLIFFSLAQITKCFLYILFIL